MKRSLIFCICQVLVILNLQAGQDSSTTTDFNSDGVLDLAVFLTEEQAIDIYLGNGDGSFEYKVTYNLHRDGLDLGHGDWDADGNQDLIFANQTDFGVQILYGNGEGRMVSQRHYPTAEAPVSVNMGDLNADGHQDLSILHQDPSAISVLLGSAENVPDR